MTNQSALREINEVIIGSLMKGIMVWRQKSQPVLLDGQADTLNGLLLNCSKENEVWATSEQWQARGCRVPTGKGWRLYNERTVSKLKSVVSLATCEVRDIPVWHEEIEPGVQVFHSGQVDGCIEKVIE